jgi:hypothetical protein
LLSQLNSNASCQTKVGSRRKLLLSQLPFPRREVVLRLPKTGINAVQITLYGPSPTFDLDALRHG